MNLHLVLAAPLLAALLTFFLSGRDPVSTLRTALLLSLAVVGLTFPLVGAGTVATTIHTWFQIPILGTTVRWGLASDGISAWLLALTAALVPAVLLNAKAVVGDKIREFAAAVFLLQAALYGAFLSVDLLQFYGFFEAMLLPATILIALFGGRERRRAAGVFLIFSLAGSAPLFVGIWYLSSAPLLAGHRVSLDFVSLQSLIGTLPPEVRVRLFWAAALAFLVKLPVVPLHMWQADAYGEGPAPGSALLTGVMAKVGLYGFLRIVIPLFPVEAKANAGVFIVLGLVTVLYGAFLALRQRQVRRVLAFSSLSHLGLGLAALFTFSPEAISGVVVLMVAHGLSAAVLFLLAGTAETWTRSRHIDDFGALASRAPVFATLFGLAALASIGLPGTAGFVAEFLLLVSLWKACGIVLAAVAGFSLILSAAYTLRLVQKILFGASSQAVAPTEKIDLAPSAALSIAPLIFALVLFGFQPGRITNTVRLQSLIPIRLPSAQAIIVEDAAHAAGR